MDDLRSARAAVPRASSQGPDPLIGRIINERYRIVGTIARGGMGKVYRAEQQPLGRLVALKVLNPNYTGDSDPEFHKRFFLEASIASKLTHPNTVTIFDYGKTDDDVYYIAMELLEGRTLHRALRDEGPFAPDRAIHIAGQICRSLREAHALGVIHRDLKPANIYLVRHDDEPDFVKVLDFGLVKNVEENGGEELTQAGLFMGSPKYMSPEQIRGEDVDGRVDVYALGVILFEMLTGKVPFDRPNSVNILMAHIHEDVPAIGAGSPAHPISPALDRVTRKCLEKNPAHRYASMEELLSALKQCSGVFGTMTGEFRLGDVLGVGAPIDPRATSGMVSVPGELLSGGTPYQGFGVPEGASPKPRRGGLTAVVLGLGVLVLGAASLLWLERSAQRQAHPAMAAALPAEDAPGAASGELSAVALSPGASQVAPARQRVVVSLRSTPPGALVFVGDQQYGPTPTELEWTGEDATEGREVTFRFARKGYREVTVTRQIRGETLEVDAPEMSPMPPPRRAPVAAKVRTRPEPTPKSKEDLPPVVAPLEGYKAEPY